METIIESGMNFIAENAFHIEKCNSYACISENIKSVEFIRLTAGNLFFVEAKNTFPNPDNPTNIQRFNEAIIEITDKFIHSINLFSAIKLCIRTEDLSVLPEVTAKITLKFILVIKTHDIKWCKPVKMKLMENLPSYFKRIWEPEVLVINHDVAIRHNICQ